MMRFMMRLLGLAKFDRYLLRQVVLQIILVWLLMLLIFSSLQLISEMRDMRADYQLFAVFWHSLLTMAYRAYILFPFAALIGALLAVSRLAAQQELTVMRVAGSSRQRLMLPVLHAVVMLLLVAVLAGELAGSWLEPKARDFRVGAITGHVSLSYSGGLWLRDGDAIMHVEWPAVRAQSEVDFSGMNIYQMHSGRLCHWLYAAQASHQQGNWQLRGLLERELCAGTEEVHLQRSHTRTWPSELSTTLLLNMALRPALLSIADLRAYVQFLQRSGLDSSRYELALYQRIYYPLTVLTLVWLALPLVLNDTRSLSRGRQLLLGLATGIVLYVGYKIVESLTGVYALHPGFTALIPAGLSLLVARWLYRQQG